MMVHQAIEGLSSVEILTGFNIVKFLNTSTYEFPISSIFALSIVTIGIVIVSFLFLVGKNTKKNSTHALGLPSGSVRAILALTLTILFVLISLYFFSVISDKEKTDLAERSITILGTLVIAISSFYFGIKATEQGSNIAQKAFDLKAKPTQTNETISPTIILAAISSNKENWIKQFNCLDIKLGKKEVGKTTFELNCIDFIIKTKYIPSENNLLIPELIQFSKDGHLYNIPTDVKELNSQPNKSPSYKFETLDKTEQYTIIEQFLEDKADKFLEENSTITGVYVGNKKTKEQTLDIICLIIQVEDKSDYIVPFPKYIEHKGYAFPTDVEIAGETSPDSNNLSVDCGVSRKDNNEFGTLGYSVNINGEIHFLSCYHVLFNKELARNLLSVHANDSIGDRTVVSPPYKINSSGTSPIGNAVSGELSRFLDVAVLKPNPAFLKQEKDFSHASKYRILRREDEHKIVLKFWGQGSNCEQQTVLKNIAVIQPVNYAVTEKNATRSSKKRITQQGLIQMSKCSSPGDSGAAIFDIHGKFVGILIGSDSSYSYAISAYNIFKRTNYKPLS